MTLPPLINEARLLASMPQTIHGVMEESDPELYHALHSGRTILQRRHHKSDEDVITRFAVEFLTARQFVPAHIALTELTIAG